MTYDERIQNFAQAIKAASPKRKPSGKNGFQDFMDEEAKRHPQTPPPATKPWKAAPKVYTMPGGNVPPLGQSYLLPGKGYERGTEEGTKRQPDPYFPESNEIVPDMERDFRHEKRTIPQQFFHHHYKVHSI
jgi:hypothetical protein